MNRFLVERLTNEALCDIAELEALIFAEPWSQNALNLLLEGKNVGFVATDENVKVVGYGGMVAVLDEGFAKEILAAVENM